MTGKQKLVLNIAKKFTEMKPQQKNSFALYLIAIDEGKELGRKEVLKELKNAGIDFPNGSITPASP